MSKQFFTGRRTFPKLNLKAQVRDFLHRASQLNRLQLFLRRTSSGTDFSLCSEKRASPYPVSCLLIAAICSSLCNAQTTEKKVAPEQKEAAPLSTPVETEKNPAQIELLETKCRFESNGDSRKEVHARVRINNELGARQFARLNFDFNRSFQSVEIPLVRITHARGGIADILPSAITDNPNPAVVDFPAYHDVRVKSVRILGLAPGDLLEYRVITTTTHHPLAPDFWFSHTFDRSGVALQQTLTLTLPFGRGFVDFDRKIPVERDEVDGVTYKWKWNRALTETLGSAEPTDPDVSASTFDTEVSFEESLASLFYARSTPSEAIRAKARSLTRSLDTSVDHVKSLYEFVSKEIATVDLPIGAASFSARPLDEILNSRSASPEDKALLFTAMVAAVETDGPPPHACLAFHKEPKPPFYDLPESADRILLYIPYLEGKAHWFDPSSEVAPFGVISAGYRGHSVLCLGQSGSDRTGLWEQVPQELPFASSQKVVVQSSLDAGGVLHARVRYTLRGDNELLLRVAFHKTPKEKRKDIAQLLALSDGFRGDIINVSASDPYETEKPFEVEYDISQPKFVDWSKRTVRIPAILPLPGLPEAEPTSAGSKTKESIDLGTPLDIQLEATIQLPEGTTVQAPTGTSVERDYATFSSKYSAEGNIIHATRKLHFISREIPTARAADWNAFLHAVQADQTQLFTLQPPAKN